MENSKVREIYSHFFDTVKTGLSPLVSGVYKFLPENVAFPYVHIFISNIEKISTFDIDITKARVTCNIVSANRSGQDVIDIMDNIYDSISGMTFNDDSVDVDIVLGPSFNRQYSDKFRGSIYCDLIIKELETA